LEPQEDEKEDSIEDDDDTRKNCPESKVEPSTKEQKNPENSSSNNMIEVLES
jgi:hypothetical protein